MATRVKFSDLELAFEFASFEGVTMGHLAYVRMDTGEILYGSHELNGEELPDDVDDEEKYLAIPSKRDLGLGRSLVFDFVEQFLPDDLDQVRRYFSRRGAYGNFKDLVAQRGAIEHGTNSRTKPRNARCGNGAARIRSSRSWTARAL